MPVYVMRPPRLGAVKMTLREHISDTLKVRVRSALAKLDIEIGAYTGSFADHRSRLLRELSISTVWDVGAHVGQYGAHLRDHGFHGRIISIEPSPHSYAELARRARADGTWDCVRQAVADSPGDRDLHVAKNGQSSSLLPMAARHLNASPDSRYIGSVSVRTTTLDLLETELHPPQPYFVKLDIQGAERAALSGGGAVLQRTIACEMELSFDELYNGQGTLTELLELMAQQGMRLCDVDRVFFDRASQDLLQVNALFRRSSDD